MLLVALVALAVWLVPSARVSSASSGAPSVRSTSTISGTSSPRGFPLLGLIGLSPA